MKRKLEFKILATSAATILLLGTVVFHYVEKWNWLDSLYFTLITITTVGYGDISPQTNLGKILTMVLIVFGIGIILTFIEVFAQKRMVKRSKKK